MNKKEFLDELGRYLLILEDGEQRDILEEYSQHIDMKVEDGLSEEEAIHDFGSVKELAAEILEAYHVKAEFPKEGRKPAQAKDWMEPSKSLLTQFFKKACAAVRNAADRCCNTMKRLWIGLSGILAAPLKGIRNLFSKEPQDCTEPRGSHSRRIQLRRPSQESVLCSLGHTTGLAVAGSFSWMVNLFFCCIRWCWNIAMMFIAFLGALFTMGVLFGFGTLIVWMGQGYPLVGVTVACFGLLLCSGAFTVLCVSFVRRRREEDAGYGHAAGAMTKEVHDA